MREALPVMTHGQIAPVDLAQASIGPGMGVYSKFAQVLRQDGKPVTVPLGTPHAEMLRIMRRLSIRHLPVVDGERLSAS